MENANNKNIIWINVAKFIGIFLVIFQHNLGQVFHLWENCGTIYFWLHGLILQFHMPLFFVLAGYLYKDKGFQENINKIIWALLIPYLLYQILYFPMALGWEVIGHHISIGIAFKKLLLGILFGDVVSDNNLFITCCGPCWFIIAMIWVRLVFAKISLNVFNACIIAFISIGLLIFLISQKLSIYFCIIPALYCLPYFILGNILTKLHIPTTDKYTNRKKEILFFLIFFFISCFILFTTHEIVRVPNIIDINSIKQLFFCYAAGISGSIATIFLSKTIYSTKNFINTISKNTLFIIFFHFVILYIEKISFIYKITNYTNIFENLFLIMASSILNLILCYFVIKLAEKYCPVLLGKYRPKNNI